MENCGDNRFELIESYRKKLIECTNIETQGDEMFVLNNILFRFWQMGWLIEKLYVVTRGECIEKVFTRSEKAERYVKQFNDVYGLLKITEVELS